MDKDCERFELHTTQSGETTCIALLGEFDVVGLDHLEAELQRAGIGSGRAVLDFRGVKLTAPTGSIDDSLGRDLVA